METLSIFNPPPLLPEKLPIIIKIKKKKKKRINLFVILNISKVLFGNIPVVVIYEKKIKKLFLKFKELISN